MRPGTERPEAGADAAHEEGAAYARALLDRIGAGTSSAADLAALVQFLRGGPLLHGACVVVFGALAAGMRSRPEA